MPTYTFINKETGEEQTHILTLSQRETFLADNPHMTQKLSTPAFGDSVRLGIRRIDDNFNNVLKKAKSAHKYSTIETR
jgi:hypothetical protein